MGSKTGLFFFIFGVELHTILLGCGDSYSLTNCRSSLTNFSLLASLRLKRSVWLTAFSIVHDRLTSCFLSWIRTFRSLMNIEWCQWGFSQITSSLKICRIELCRDRSEIYWSLKMVWNFQIPWRHIWIPPKTHRFPPQRRFVQERNKQSQCTPYTMCQNVTRVSIADNWILTALRHSHPAHETWIDKRKL